MPAAAQNRTKPAWRSADSETAARSPQKPHNAAAFAGGFSATVPNAAELSYDNALHQSAAPREANAEPATHALREATKSFAPAPHAASTPSESLQARRAERRRAQRAHRPLRVRLTHFVCGAAVLGQLVLLLWVHGRALSASHRADKLDLQIVAKQNLVERTQERIAALDASPQLNHWAAERGWRMALHSDFDDVTEAVATVPPLKTSPPATDPDAQSTLSTNSIASVDAIAPQSTLDDGKAIEKPSQSILTPESGDAGVQNFVGEAP